MKWLNHELDDEPWPECDDEPEGWTKEQLMLMLLTQRLGKPTVETRNLEPIADWLIGSRPAPQLTPSVSPSQRKNEQLKKNMDFRPMFLNGPLEPSIIKFDLTTMHGIGARLAPGDIVTISDRNRGTKKYKTISINHSDQTLAVRELTQAEMNEERRRGR